MSTFWIFAACLTLAYAIYYTVVICMDIYGKPKGQRQTTTETFNIDDIAPEASVAVEKTDDGYRIGKTTNRPDEEPQWEEKPIVTSIKKDAPNDSLTATDNSSSPANKKIESTQSEMEEIEPKLSTELMSAVMKSALETGKPPVPIKKEVVKPDSENPTCNQNETKNNAFDRL